MAFLAKKQHFSVTGFMAFDDNHGFHDFRVSLILYCLNYPTT